MSERTTITLQKANLVFLDKEANGNRSAFINRLIEKERRIRMAEAFAQANREEAADKEQWEELAAWDVTLSDGLEEEE